MYWICKICSCIPSQVVTIQPLFFILNIYIILGWLLTFQISKSKLIFVPGLIKVHSTIHSPLNNRGCSFCKASNLGKDVKRFLRAILIRFPFSERFFTLLKMSMVLIRGRFVFCSEKNESLNGNLGFSAEYNETVNDGGAHSGPV